MKNKILSILFYLFASIFIILYIFLEIKPNSNMTEMGRLFLLCTGSIFIYFGGVFLSKYRKDIKPMKINLWIFFTLYLILLITLTLFDYSWGRGGFNTIKLNELRLMDNVNLIPFKTIKMFISEFNSLYDTRTVLLNLFGNVIALMPMAFFLPFIFKKQNKFKVFLLTIFIIILLIELLQLITGSGSFDIDDIILNSSGAIIMYLIIKIKPVNSLLKNIFLKEKNKITKKEYICIFISIMIIIILSICLVKYRNKLYQNNLNEYMYITNPNLKIVNKTTFCEEMKELFYEDELYKYYFPCKMSDNVYILINNSDEYKIKDLLIDNHGYNIDIRKILILFDNNNFNYLKERKYKNINLDLKLERIDGVSYSPKTKVIVDNKDILDAKFDYYSVNYEKDLTYSIDLYLIPKKEGKTNIKVIFEDFNGKLILTKEYEVIINNKLEVNYNEKN